MKANKPKYGDDLFNVAVHLSSMMEPSPSKRTMKFKKQELHPVFPPSSVSSNIDNIIDTKNWHVDLKEFLKRVRESPVSYKMEPTINSGIHLVVAFPMSA